MPHVVDGATCYTSAEAAKMLGLKQNTFYWNVHAGNIEPDRRVGREPLFALSTLKKYYEKRTGEKELPRLPQHSRTPQQNTTA